MNCVLFGAFFLCFLSVVIESSSSTTTCNTMVSPSDPAYLDCSDSTITSDNIYCIGEDSCKNSILFFKYNIGCDTENSCNYARMESTSQYGIHSMFLGASNGALHSNLINVENVMLESDNVLNYGKIDSNNVVEMNVYFFNAQNGELDIYCRSDSECNIHCYNTGCNGVRIHYFNDNNSTNSTNNVDITCGVGECTPILINGNNGNTRRVLLLGNNDEATDDTEKLNFYLFTILSFLCLFFILFIFAFLFYKLFLFVYKYYKINNNNNKINSNIDSADYALTLA